MTVTINGSTGGTALTDQSAVRSQKGVPAFSYYASGSTSVPTSTYTKVLFAAQEFDITSAVTGSKFQPTVAGYYQISASIYYGTNLANASPLVYKNGAAFKYLSQTTQTAVIAGSCLVYLNGSTDYIEIYAYQTSGSTATVGAGQAVTYFQGALLIAA